MGRLYRDVLPHLARTILFDRRVTARKFPSSAAAYGSLMEFANAEDLTSVEIAEHLDSIIYHELAAQSLLLEGGDAEIQKHMALTLLDQHPRLRGLLIGQIFTNLYPVLKKYPKIVFMIS